MAYERSLDHAFLAKYGFLLGVSLLAVGAGGELIGNGLYGSLPAWEATLFFDLEVAGVLIGFFSPTIFGIALPLLE